MLQLLSKLKSQLQSNGVELINSSINGDAIKLMCTVNGRRDTEINAYIIPDGDGFNFYTMSPSEGKSKEIKLTEEQILPTILNKVDPEKHPYEVEEKPVSKTTDKLMDEVTIEVEDGVFDTKVVPHNTYKNSRFAYSTKYNKMGTIFDVRLLNSEVKVNSDVEVEDENMIAGIPTLPVSEVNCDRLPNSCKKAKIKMFIHDIKRALDNLMSDEDEHDYDKLKCKCKDYFTQKFEGTDKGRDADDELKAKLSIIDDYINWVTKSK